MTKILYNTIEHGPWTIKYYLTNEEKDGFTYYGIMATSESDCSNHLTSISGIFPYEENVKELLCFLYNNKVPPLSMKDVIMDYLEEKIICS